MSDSFGAQSEAPQIEYLREGFGRSTRLLILGLL